MNIAFDECGNTGENLLDPEQWVFTLSSTSISDAEASRLLSVFSGRIQGEYKYTKLKRARRNQGSILDVLKDRAITSSTCKTYVIHKPFMTICKLVDNVFEPVCREFGIDMYEGRTAQATANLLSCALPISLGQTRYIRFLGLFSTLCRSKTQPAFDSFHKEAASIYTMLKRKHPDAVDVFVPVVVACQKGLPFFADQVPSSDHDPIIPAYHELAVAWSQYLGARFSVLADDSKVLAAERPLLLQLSDPALKPETIYYYDSARCFPLKIDGIILEDSQASSALQLADFIAGAVCQAFNTKAINGFLSGFEQDLMDIIIAKELIIGGIWPGRKVTAEGFGATGEYHGNPADRMSTILTDAGKKKHRAQQDNF